ncbi:MAG: methylated-DNA--[protein]-cysteine S-methyltransferase [Candidatus Aminicenantales bacterium]
MEKNYKAFYMSKVGVLKIEGTERAILSVGFTQKKPQAGRSQTGLPPVLKECIRQLDEYFKGKRKKFTVKLLLEGTDFQKKVWKELMKIPYGRTASYGEIARAVGRPKAARAVGGANHVNPIGIIVPCHRVIGSDGSLVGYGSGLGKKEWLLKHERRFS